MADINRTNLTGRLTRDSELRALPGGGTTLSFSIAVNDAVRNRDAGEWDERANYIDCVVFGKRAEALSSRLKKGVGVAVEGRLRWSSWESKEGAKRTRIEVVVDKLKLLASSAMADNVSPTQDLADQDLPF